MKSNKNTDKNLAEMADYETDFSDKEQKKNPFILYMFFIIFPSFIIVFTIKV